MSTRPLSSLARAGATALSALLLTVLSAGAAHAQTNDAYHSAPLDTLPVTAYQGWKQFELNCSRCHGEYAVGTSFAPALVVSLKQGGTVPTKEMFIQTVCAGRPDRGMPSWCALGLEMDKINNIYDYVKGRADGKIHAGRPALKRDAESKSSG
jgi:mono/diheme cytochrome c family protein